MARNPRLTDDIVYEGASFRLYHLEGIRTDIENRERLGKDTSKAKEALEYFTGDRDKEIVALVEKEVPVETLASAYALTVAEVNEILTQHKNS